MCPAFLAFNGLYKCEHGRPDSSRLVRTNGSTGKIFDDGMHYIPQLVTVFVNIALAALGGEHLACPALAKVDVFRGDAL